MEQLSTHTFVIPEDTNCGIIDTGDSLILVDSGEDHIDAKRILSQIKENFPEKQIKSIINTHSHADHCGSNFFIKEQTGCEIWATFAESKTIEYPELLSSQMWGGKPFRKIRSRYFEVQKTAAVSKYLEDNQTIEASTVKIQIIPLPGHSFDQIGVLVTDKTDGKKSIFLGDALYGRKILKRYWLPVMYDPELFYKSLEFIEELQLDYFIPSHSEIFTLENIHEICELNKILILEAQNLILKVLKNHPEGITSEKIIKEAADYAGINMDLGQLMLVSSTMRSFLTNLSDQQLIKFQVQNNLLLWMMKQYQNKTI